eukprot:GDKJ01014799.1.p1 GENE.GDKJ01014799.1~~GDKJ01014799.1.p1  ORF type:complete len:2331 (+),score=545.59 GDKJ01014799.1:688-6993(+)
MRTWTTLSETATAGMKQLKLTEAVDWQVGDRLVLTHHSSMDATEDITVESVVDNGMQVNLVDALKYDHVVTVIDLKGYVPTLSNPSASRLSETYTGCEVGLVSRSVRFEGTPTREKFGMHSMAQHGALLNMENVEVTNCGQQGVVGHYCTHFHMPGAMPDGFVRYNSIHHSWQRATTIHAVHKATIQGNVAWDICGHSIFIEDANEFYNNVIGNLVVVTRRNPVLLSGDLKPASFWTPNPNNYFRDNVAAGSVSFGFWFELADHPTGPSYTETICPAGEDLGEFRNNRAHSNSIGLRIYPQFAPRDPPCGGSFKKPQYLYGSVMHHNAQGFFHKKVTDIHHHESAFIENDQGGSWLRFHDMYFDQPPNFYQSVFVGAMDSTENHSRNGIELPQREFWRIKDSAFVNFPNAFAMKTCHDCNADEEYSQGAFTYRMEGLQFENVKTRLTWGIPKKEIVHDIDGSLGGTANRYITYYYKYFDMPECAKTAVEIENGTSCSLPIRKVGLKAILPHNFDNKPMTVVSSSAPNADSLLFTSNAVTAANGVTAVDNINFRMRGLFSGWTLPLVVNKFYNLMWAPGPNFERLQIAYSDPEYVFQANGVANAVPEYVGLTFAHTAYRDRFEVSLPYFNPDPPAGEIPDKGSLPNVQLDGLQTGLELADDFDVYNLLTSYESLPFGTNVHTGLGDTGKFAVMLSTGSSVRVGKLNELYDPFTVSIKGRECPEIGCWAPPRLAALDPPHLWSDALAWARYGSVMPSEGDAVTIKNTQYVILDMNPPKLTSLSIEGKLEVQNENAAQTFTLRANSIVVWGVFEAGTPVKPLLPKFNLIFYGDSSNSPNPQIEEGLFLPGKSLTVVGTLSMIGKEVALPWTVLATKASIGATVIEVLGREALNWAVGDKVILGGTSYRAREEAETLTIASIDPTPVEADGEFIVKVTVSTPLQHQHVSIQQVIADRLVTVRAPVGHLARSIVIRDETTVGTVRADGFGWDLHVVSKRPVYERSGVSKIRFVSMVGAGKKSSKYAAVNYDYSPTFTNSTYGEQFSQLLDGCVIDSMNLGIRANTTQNIQMTRNIVTHAIYYGVEMDEFSVNAKINKNLIMNIERDPQWQIDWYIPFAAIAMLAPPREMRSNFVSGSDDTAYYYYAPSCPENIKYITRNYVPAWPSTPAVYEGDILVSSEVTGPAITGNIAVGTTVGVLPVPHPFQICKIVHGFSISYASHLAIVVVDELSNVLFSNNTVTDSHVGFSFNGLQTAVQTFAVVNATIVGESDINVDCSINANECLNYNKDRMIRDICDSAFLRKTQEKVRRVGMFTPQNYDSGKTCYHNPRDMTCRPLTTPSYMCALPWEGEFGVRSNQRQFVDAKNTVFANFLASTCNQYESRAVSSNPEWQDYVGEMNFEKTTWVNTQDQNKLKWGYSSCFRSGYDNTDGSICDAASLAFGQDIDGTFVNKPAGGAIAANTAFKMGDLSKCEEINGMDSVRWCPQLPLRSIVVKNMDVDSNRHIAPLVFREVATAEQLATNTYTPISFGTNGNQKMEPCSLVGYVGVHSGAVHPNRRYKVNLSATNPATTRIYYFGESGEDVIIDFFYIQPSKLEVFYGPTSTRGQNSNNTPISFSSPHAAYSFNPQTRYITVMLKGSTDSVLTGSNYIDIKTLPLVQISLTADVRISQFSGPNLISNIATLLSIPADRIKVADPGFLSNTGRRLQVVEPTPAMNGPLPAGMVDTQSNTITGDISTGKTIVVTVEPSNNTVSTDPTVVQSQINSVTTIKTQVNAAIVSGALVQAVSSLPAFATVPAALVFASTNCGTPSCPDLSIVASAVSFTDIDNTAMTLGGTFNINAASNEGPIDGYKVYWGDVNGVVIDALPVVVDVPKDSDFKVFTQYQIPIANLEIRGNTLVTYAYNAFGLSTGKNTYTVSDLDGFVYVTPLFTSDPGTGGTNDPSLTPSSGGTDSKDNKGSSKTTLIVVLVVVGCVLIAGGVGGYIWWMRRKSTSVINPVSDASFDKVDGSSLNDMKENDLVKSTSLPTQEPAAFEKSTEVKAKKIGKVTDSALDPQEAALNKLNDWLKEQRKKKETRKTNSNEANYEPLDQDQDQNERKSIYGNYKF